MVDSTGAARPRSTRCRAARRPARRCGSASTSTPPGGRWAAGCTSAYAARRCTAPRQAGALAAAVAGRPGFRLVGLMSYEAQIAGARRRAARAGRCAARAIRLVQRRSLPELLRPPRRPRSAAVREHADLEFVNGGGTGSVAATSADPAVTEVTAGSGLYGPTLFDAYRAWRPTPAAFFACSVVRRPAPRTGDRARRRLDRLRPGRADAGCRARGCRRACGCSAPRAPARCRPRWPARPPTRCGVGDRVWFRHAKAGELCEHVNELHLVEGDAVVRDRADLPRRGPRLPLTPPGRERRRLEPAADRIVDLAVQVLPDQRLGLGQHPLVAVGRRAGTRA